MKPMPTPNAQIGILPSLAWWHARTQSLSIFTMAVRMNHIRSPHAPNPPPFSSRHQRRVQRERERREREANRVNPLRLYIFLGIDSKNCRSGDGDRQGRGGEQRSAAADQVSERRLCDSACLRSLRVRFLPPIRQYPSLFLSLFLFLFLMREGSLVGFLIAIEVFLVSSWFFVVIVC